MESVTIKLESYFPRPSRACFFSKNYSIRRLSFPQEELQHEYQQHTQHHQQHIATHLATLQQAKLATSIINHATHAIHRTIDHRFLNEGIQESGKLVQRVHDQLII